MIIEFSEFPKIPRLSRECVITEKIDGTNASITITHDGQFLVGSRTRFITPENDNFGFAKWAYAHREELTTLGVGTHYGEWWGAGIQRGYGRQTQRNFSLFNTTRWAFAADRPVCCGVVPVLYRGEFSTEVVARQLQCLRFDGSHAAPGFMRPEGVVIYHEAARIMFKKTLEKDEQPKGVR